MFIVILQQEVHRRTVTVFAVPVLVGSAPTSNSAVAPIRAAPRSASRLA